MSAGLTNAWSNIKSSYGAGTGGLAKSSALSGLGAGLGTLMGNPLAGILFTQLGTALMGKLLGGSSPSEQNIAQMAGIGRTLIPQLQQQAAGMPTAATKAQGNYLNQEVSRAMQASGASASRAMPGSRQYGQTAPARVAQNRLQGSRIEGMANIMGASQLQAQQQLQQLFGAGVGAQQQLEASEAGARARTSANLATIYAMMKNPQQLGANQYSIQAYDILKKLISETTGVNTGGNVNTGNTVSTAKTPSNFSDSFWQNFRGQNNNLALTGG